MRNPIFRKEMREIARSPKLVWVITILNVAWALIGVCMLRVYFYSDGERMLVDYSMILNIYYILLCVQLGSMAFILPGMTAGAIAGEIEKQTLSALLTTPLGPWRIVVGKLHTIVFNVGLYLISGLPILAIIFFVGGVSLKDLAQYVVYVFVFGFYMGSIGVCISSLVKNTILSQMLTYGAFVMVCALNIAVNWLVYMLQLPSGTILQYGKILVLGLINPIDSMASMLAQQMGRDDIYNSVCLLHMNKDSVWVKHVDSATWFWMSAGVQCIISIVLMVVSTYALCMPSKKKSE